MNIPTNVILVWVGTHAGIPSGWSRETTLDDKYPKAWGAEAPNTTGGAANHTHTSAAHSHTATSHTHQVSAAAAAFTATVDTGSTAANTFEGAVSPARSHDHAANTSSASTGGDLSSVTSTYDTVANDPPYRKVIFIKASGGTLLQTNICALWGGFGGSSTIPTNWSEVTEVRNRYLKGAGTGADADLVTDSGSYTNVHALTHTHTVAAHSHATSTSNGPQNYGGAKNSSVGSTAISITHTHTYTITDATGTLTGSVSLTTAETVEPAYSKLSLIKKGASGLKEKGLIGLWLGTAATIPSGWKLCDGTNGTIDLRDKFIKCGNSTAEIGNTGGSNTHTHASQTHTHTGAGHTHTGSVSTHTNTTSLNGSGTSVATAANQTDHAISVATGTAVYATASTTADSTSNQPLYRTAVYIQLQRLTQGGAFLLNML